MVSKLSTEEIREFIGNNNFGRLGCNDGERTYVVPINYLYFDSYFLCYSLDGMKIEMMREHPLVCLEIDRIRSIKDWVCVIAFGRYEEIGDPKSRTEAKEYFIKDYLRLRAEQTEPAPESSLPSVELHHKEIVYYRIQIEELSGRFAEHL
jgi:nitroimidazol reductase NimA-like FMN-containing flavoprotein (pyridoxamine 5'-phosphate oxidase superfamily)